MNEIDVENELRTLRPAAPSPEMARRIAASLEMPPAATLPSLFTWWVERLLWSGGGAVATVFAIVMLRQTTAPHASPPEKLAASTAPAAQIAEEPLAWTDEGVRFISDQIPARLLRRVSLERHLADDGTEVQVPREDVILVPVALR